eukprot:10034388-Prorocentrum_lima.AAC.1
MGKALGQHQLPWENWTTACQVPPHAASQKGWPIGGVDVRRIPRRLRQVCDCYLRQRTRCARASQSDLLQTLQAKPLSMCQTHQR